MACNSCAKSFSFLRKEKGCPNCGFSYCAKCLNNTVFLKKTNSEAKVCTKCTQSSDIHTAIEPPNAYFKRIGAIQNEPERGCSIKQCSTALMNTKDEEILNRLKKLKEDSMIAPKGSEAEIAKRLQQLKGEMPSTSDVELHERLAKLRGIDSASVSQNKPVFPTHDHRTEQEQVDDLMKQYLEQEKIEGKYKNEFNTIVNEIESRLHTLKGSLHTTDTPATKEVESEDEEEVIKKLIDKLKTETILDEQETYSSPQEELPFCEICNEDAKMRCLGCKYLFCKQCFLEHKDDDDGCDRYEPYKPPNT